MKVDEAWNYIRKPLWTQLEAACCIQGIRPIPLEVFANNPLLYPDIDDYYKIFKEPCQLRLRTEAFAYGEKVGSREPMVWICIAAEYRDDDRFRDGLYMGPGIAEAWVIHQGRAQKRYVDPSTNKSNIKKCMKEKKGKIKISGRSLHEADDRDFVMELGRKIHRQNPDLKKKQIVEIIYDRCPRANCYKKTTVTKWLTMANIALAGKGRPKKF
jgi:hypothetical protein